MKRLLVFALLCTGTTVARAQNATSLPDGSTLNFSLLYLHENNNPNLAQPIQLPTSLYNYFNYAHCVCSEANAPTKTPFFETTFAYLIQLSGVTNGSELQPLVGEIWVGSSCNVDTPTREAQCHQITSATIPSIGGIQATNGTKPEITIQEDRK